MNDRRNRKPTDAELQQAIVREHLDTPHAKVDKKGLRAHLLIHAMVEKQLIDNDPPETRLALERLEAESLSRHEAVHRIGKVVMKEAMEMMKQGRELDRQAYAEALKELSVEEE